MLVCCPRFDFALGSLRFVAIPEAWLRYQPGPAPLNVEVAPRFVLMPDDAPESFIDSGVTFKTHFQVTP